MITQAYNKALTFRTADWTYIEPSAGPAIVPWGTEIETGSLSEPQLYNNASDPLQTTNVASSNPEITATLASQLSTIR